MDQDVNELKPKIRWPALSRLEPLVCAAMAVGLVLTAGCAPTVKPEHIRRTPFAAGEVLGEVLASEIELGGEVLVVASWDVRDEINPMASSFVDGLTEGIGTTRVQVTVANCPIPDNAAFSGVVRVRQIVHELEERADVRALVFYNVAPDRIKKGWPPIYLMTATGVDTEGAKLPAYARAAVVCKSGVDWLQLPDASESSQETFDARYQMLRR